VAAQVALYALLALSAAERRAVIDAALLALSAAERRAVIDAANLASAPAGAADPDPDTETIR